MACIVFASSKGGVGKTTSCIALAVQAALNGVPTAILELDPNQPIDDFFGLQAHHGRHIPNLHFPEDPCPTDPLVDRVDAIHQHFELLLVDLPGAASDDMVNSATASDLVVIPMQSSHWDLREVKRTRKSVASQTRRLPDPPLIRVLLTRTPPNPILPGHYRDAVALLEAEGIERFQVELTERKDWRNITSGGLYPPEGSAAFENAAALYREIEGLLVADAAEHEKASAK